MTVRSHAPKLVALAIVLASPVVYAGQGRPTPPGAQRAGQPPVNASDPLAAAVRTALAHGSVADATRAIDASRAASSSKELATALVEMYQGKDEAAQPRLARLAEAAPLGEASLELALLDLRHGRRDEAKRRLDALTAVRTLNGVDDYFRLARAGAAEHEFQLANDAYQRIPDVPRADVQTGRADLFLYRHQPADALVNYKQALAADPAWVPAQLGLARALVDGNLAPEDPEQAASLVAAAVKAAPEDPDVWTLVADRALGEEDWTGAAKALDRLTALRPGTVDEAAMRAELAYATDHPTEIEPQVARATAVDPTSAQVYVALGRVAADLYRIDEAVAFDRKAVALDPADRDAQFALGSNLLRAPSRPDGQPAPDETDARAALEAAWALDKSNRFTKNDLDMLDSLATFEVVRDGNLVFRFSKDEAAVLKLYALPLGEEALRTFQEHYQFTPTGPILVELFPRHEDFGVRTIGLGGIGDALGACFGRVVAMDSPHARPPGLANPGEFSWQATEWHELAHVFTLQLSRYRVPRWLTEGISVYEEHRRNPAWGREDAVSYARLWSQGKTFGVKGLPEAFKDSENFGIAYFEASLVVEHLVALKGDAGLRTLLQAYADGATDEVAFNKAFGEGVDAVDASFRQFVNGQYGTAAAALKPLAGPPVDPADLTAVRAQAAAAPGSFGAQLELGQVLVKAGDDRDAVAPLRRAADLVPQSQGPGSPHALLEQIASRAGDNAGARRELHALLTYDQSTDTELVPASPGHEHVTVARELVRLATEAHDEADLDFGLRLLVDLEPFDGGAEAALGRRELAAGTKDDAAGDHEKAAHDRAGALTRFEAALATKPANLAEAHADLAETLIALTRRDEAKREALLALEEAPTYARAQDLLLAAMGK